ncbi:MAG: sensor histidine kinase [Oscillospiraceae bacterium]|jgi:two-component system sensor histidine kinase YesM|nr:sensor histidine kinase [Oscillospiraceae bacterium]
MERWTKRLSIRVKTLVVILLLSLAPQCLLARQFYLRSRETLTETTRQSMYQLLRVNNERTELDLATLHDVSMNILVDRELFTVFSDPMMSDPVNRRETEEAIHKILLKYFGSLPSVQQVEIITPAYSYVMNWTRLAQFGVFFQSDVFQDVWEKNGGIAWLSSKAMEPFHHRKSTFACARLLNLRYVDDSSIGWRLETDQDAVLMVMLNEAYFKDRLEATAAAVPGSVVCMVTPEGETLVYTGGEALDISGYLPEMQSTGTGMLRGVAADGSPMALCYDQSMRTGWLTVSAFSVNALAEDLSRGLYVNMLGIMLVMALTTLLATGLSIRMLTRRIRSVSQGVDAVKAGDYSARIDESRCDEFSALVENVNAMSETLRRLIDENYKARIGEQEARLTTLMMQFNPHFLYNTLNVINWSVLAGRGKEASRLVVTLSRMLRYTSDSTRPVTPLREDMEWLEQYLFLMHSRFEGLFNVEWDVAPECLDCLVPKLFLQPLLENSILHGFGGRSGGGEIRIRARLDGTDLIAVVEDNGKGIPPDKAARILADKRVSIGLYNTHNRIALMYGEGYGLNIDGAPGSGCRVTARIRAEVPAAESAV